jgi:isoamylase
MINAYWEALEFELPPLGEANEAWRRCVDTFLAPPEDVCRLPDAPVVPSPTYPVQPRSLVILFATAGADVNRSAPTSG